MPQHALLLNRSRFGIALGDDQAAQCRTVLARNLLPDLLAIIVAEADLALGIAIREENSPAIIGHAYEAVCRPSLGVDGGRGAQVNVGNLKILWAELLPPVQKFRLPVLQRA